MNSENNITSDPHILLLNLSGKIDLKRSQKYVVLSNLSQYYTWKKYKEVLKQQKIDLKQQLQRRIKLMDHIIYQIFKITLSILSK